MKNLLFFVFILLATFTLLQSCEKPKTLELNVMSFNVRYDNAEDSLNNWKYRKDAACQVIKNFDVDILGTQEVLSGQLEDMKLCLPGYSAVGVGRADGISKGEFSALFYKKDKFKELDSGTFWLSETPTIAGSKGWDGACERIATWAVLKHLATGLEMFAVNTHLDHVGKKARINGVTLILERISVLGKDLPVVFTGDFNSGSDSDVVNFITDKEKANSLISTREYGAIKSDKEWTFHAFGKLPEEKRSYLDYIFVSKGTEVLEYKVAEEKLDNIYVSDHMPVFAKIRVK